MNQQKIGEFLKQLRENKGLTQAQLAEHFNTTSRTVSRWETGSNLPDVDMLVDLADFYEVDIREILDGEKKDGDMDGNTGDAIKKAAEYTEKERRIPRNRVVAYFAGCGAIIAAVINILFNEESAGVLVGIVPESVCQIIVKFVIAASIVGAGMLALYVLGAFDGIARRKKR